MANKNIKDIVKSKYAEIAVKNSSCCPGNACCGGKDTAKELSRKVGYTDKEMGQVPDNANLGLGCGNPTALAGLKKGETVLDLGSGAGFDAFLAAKKVGKTGKVIGVDMTLEMVKKARKNAEKGGYENVEFKLGEIESLPVDDNTADVILSNCVINLSINKPKVFREAYRVLKPGGRLMVSDIVLLKELPLAVKKSVDAYVGCVAGAIRKEKYIDAALKAGFTDLTVIDETPYPIEYGADDVSIKAIEKSVVSIKLSGVKPGARKTKTTVRESGSSKSIR